MHGVRPRITRNSLVAWRIQTPTATYGTTFRPKRSARSWNRLPPHCCCAWSAPVHHQHRVAHGPAVLVRGASPVRRVGQASSRRADRDTGTRWPPSMGSGKPTTGRPVCGARRRPPYRTRMTRDMGTCRNALRITWFGQRHLTSTLDQLSRSEKPPNKPAFTPSDHFLQVNIFRLLKLEHAIFRHPPKQAA